MRLVSDAVIVVVRRRAGGVVRTPHGPPRLSRIPITRASLGFSTPSRQFPLPEGRSLAVRPHVPVFDIGGVLIDWDPRYLYAKLLPDGEAVERFLAEICTPAWNLEQDRGRPWDEAVDLLVARHPDQADLIRAYRDRWSEMVPGAFEDTVALLRALAARGPVHAITNFSADKLDECRRRFDFLGLFETIIVSGEVGLVKPDPAIYRTLLERADVPADACLFIDDVDKNVDGARAVGMHAVRFDGAETLRRDLAAYGML